MAVEELTYGRFKANRVAIEEVEKVLSEFGFDSATCDEATFLRARNIAQLRKPFAGFGDDSWLAQQNAARETELAAALKSFKQEPKQ